MDSTLTQYLDAALRWLHVGAGVVWLCAHVVALGYEVEPTRKVVPPLVPRALYFFRWGALFTWVSGLLLIGLVYHLGGLMVGADATVTDRHFAFRASLALLLLGFFIYDQLWKSPLGRSEPVGAAISLALFAAMAFGLSRVMAGRALWLHLGAILGSVMTLNVWMRIWPAQRKILRGIKETGPTPGPEVAALAALRSKHNFYLSLPVLFFMVAPHTFPVGFGAELNWAWATGVVAAGWLGAKFLVFKAGSAAPLKSP